MGAASGILRLRSVTPSEGAQTGTSESEYQVKKWLKEQTRDQRPAKERGFHHKRSELLGL